jgi:hypothetical protein
MEKKMNKKWLPHIIAAGAFAVFILLGLASGTMEKATKKITFNSIEESKEYLASQEENKSDNPIKIAVPADDSTLKDVLDAIKSAGKYVSLELSGNALTTIPPNAFKDNTFITNITLPDSVISIQDNAFSGCPNLSGMLLGSKVASISNTAFHNCPELIWINVNDRNRNYSSGLLEGKEMNYRLLYNKEGNLLIRCPEGYKGSISTGTLEIGPYAFYGSGITSVTFRGGGFNLNTGETYIQEVYENAFVNCTSLISVTFNGFGTKLVKGSFDGDLFEQWKAATGYNEGTNLTFVGFKGTFTTTAPVNKNSKWTKR